MNVFKKQGTKGCCSGNYDSEKMMKALEKKKQGSRIKVLGTGCAKCISLETNIKEALQEWNHMDEIEHITDVIEIASYGVMSTPALVVDGEVVSFGKVLSKQECMVLLKKTRVLI